ncbi:hypothetical protein [Mobilicoccus pelagius]|uniref:Uncharacterized protein n=1 Tax=Mobilicoccus pelagius NBRC 104925 TaxID=1089455 RepID=H5UUD7_9MICO|nr:hypothetical protein [Mobilicoccus pelagius]GAB49345.1 hypothetical protein MOPEL_113_00250 [Mobilicoccus pelagius NBRC 104925]
MTALHLLLLTCSAVLAAAVTAGTDNLRRHGEDLPIMGGIVGGALVLGNAACLLPSAPRWYQVAMVALTVAGIAWLLVTVASAVRATTRDERAEAASRDIYAGRLPGEPVRPHLRVVRSTATDTATDTGESAPAPAPAARADLTVEDDLSEHPGATQATFDAAAPAEARFTTGVTYVAADIDAYIDARGTRRAHGRHVPRNHSSMDPTERFLRLTEAYSTDRRPRSLGRSPLA